MSLFYVESKNQKKSEKKTFDEQVFGNFRIETRGKIEEHMEWLTRLDEDPNLEIPEKFFKNGVLDLDKLLKKYPLLGQDYEVLTGTISDVMMKQIDEDGYVGHIYMHPDRKKLKFIQIYGHKDFLKNK